MRFPTSDQPFSDGMRIQFENARKLWTQKLLPLLERTHGVTWQDMAEGRADPRAAANLRNDARLLKTLLLAALVPGGGSIARADGGAAGGAQSWQRRFPYSGARRRRRA